MFLSRRPTAQSFMRFLRVSGGVSAQTVAVKSLSKFSPRKRRCFQRSPHGRSLLAVFSAQAEVFPLNNEPKTFSRCILCANVAVVIELQLITKYIPAFLL